MANFVCNMGVYYFEIYDIFFITTATKNTVLVADDTDLVILLCYYADPDGVDLFVQCSTRETTKKNRVWDIKVTQSEVGADICNNILFIHAIDFFFLTRFNKI